MLIDLKWEAKAQWEKFCSLGWFQKLAVVGLALVLIAVPSWRAWQSARSSELDLLYASAYSGNLESVKKMSSYRLSGGTAWLERLARARDADAYARVAAIDQLTQSRSLKARGLVPLLSIDVPFVVRHESAHLFTTRGCDADCIRMSLDSLHAMWAGRPPLEAQLAAEDHPEPQDDNFVAQLRATTEADYLRLLKGNPCRALAILHSDYSTDAGFIAKLESDLPRC